MARTAFPHTSHFLTFRQHEVHYLKFGQGKEKLIALHGYGDNAELYLNIAGVLAKKYTVFALDLPYHGKTNWNETVFFTPNDLAALIETLCNEQQIKRFSLMGYSMGGKIALSLLPNFAKQLNGFFLIASSGLKMPFFYSLIENAPIFLVKKSEIWIDEPKTLFFLLKTARRLKLISPFVHRFTRRLTNSTYRRRRLFNIWIILRHFNSDISEVQRFLNRFGIKTMLFFGKKDDIAPPSAAQHFAKKLDKCSLYMINAHHNIFNQDLRDNLQKALFD
ncbi:MAG: alpha/beta fold hydrolase [Chitinophagales bacterium]